MPLQDELKSHIQNEKIKFDLQPVVSILPEDPIRDYISIEAFMRWRVDTGNGTRTPYRTIPPPEIAQIAEQHGFIDEFTKCVLDRVLDYANHTREKGIPSRFSVNVSVKALGDQNFAVQLEEILQKYDYPPEKFSIELEAKDIVSSTATIKSTIDSIASIGCRVTVDNIASLDMLDLLSQIPVNEIKIDKILVEFIDSNKQYQDTVGKILQYGDDRDIDCIAMGVCDSEVVTKLQEMGLRYGQGDYYGSVSDYNKFLWERNDYLGLDEH